MSLLVQHFVFVYLLNIVTVSRKILKSVDVYAIDDLGVKEFHFQLDILFNYKHFEVLLFNLLIVVFYLSVEIPLTHLLQQDFILLGKSINEGSICVEKDGILAVVVVELVLHPPTLDQPKPAV